MLIKTITKQFFDALSVSAVSEESYPKMLVGLNESPWTIIILEGFNDSEFPMKFWHNFDTRIWQIILHKEIKSYES